MVTAKRVISSGSLGKAVAINGLWVLYKPLPYFDPPAEWKRHNSSGGVVLINMIHEVDLLHYLFGPIITVQADKMISQRDFGAEEGAALPMRFESGVVGSILVSDNLPSPYNFEAGTGENRLIPHTGQDFYRIFGTDASLSIPDMTLWSYRGHRSLGMRSSPVRASRSPPMKLPSIFSWITLSRLYAAKRRRAAQPRPGTLPFSSVRLSRRHWKQARQFKSSYSNSKAFTYLL